MHSITDNLAPPASSLPRIPLDGPPTELLLLREGLNVALQRCGSPLDVTSRIVGEDLFKVHVQLAGKRLLTFEKRHEVEIPAKSISVLMHDLGVSKVERLVASPKAQSLTVHISRQRVWQYLDEERTVVSPALHSFMVRKRSGPRLAVAKPAAQELALAEAVINSPRTGALRRIFAEAKAMELFCFIMDRFQAAAPSTRDSFRIGERDRRQLARVRDVLNEQFVDPPTIHLLARRSGLNRNKLCSGFLTLYGVTIYDFCRNLRLEKARELLMKYDLSIAHVAHQSGFASVSAFSASFSRQFGHTPSRTRRL